MRTKICSYILMLLVGVTAGRSVAFAEQTRSQTGSPALATIAAQHAAKKHAHRQMILNVLHREEVRKVAKRAGVRVDRAAAAVATLEGVELAQIVEQARDVEDALAGGGLSSVRVAAIILVLLAIILLYGWHQMSTFL